MADEDHGAHIDPSAPSPLGARFAANLRRERLAAALSQEELAFRAGLHPTAVGLLERGLRLPALGTILKLAGSLEVAPSAMLEGIAWRPGPEGESGRFEVTPRDDGPS